MAPALRAIALALRAASSTCPSSPTCPQDDQCSLTSNGATLQVSCATDYYGGDLFLLRDEFKDIGFEFLMDETVTVNDQLTIIGRKDETDQNRQSISSLMEGADDTLPVIVIDHQPKEISEAHEAGADLIVSGHTHRGQVFPANLITSMIYENDWGYLKRDQLHSFTTSGFGFWGPAIRIGSRSEVMSVTLQY